MGIHAHSIQDSDTHVVKRKVKHTSSSAVGQKAEVHTPYVLSGPVTFRIVTPGGGPSLSLIL